MPGVELSPEQMAQLTSDIVWLVQKKVTLASGETRNVLVPQVYVRVQESDLNGSGSLIAGQRLNLNIAGDLVNSGSLAGRSVMAITAQNIENLGGRIQADKVSLTARENLDNLGGLIGATDSLAINAGQNVNVVSSSRDSSSAQGTRTNLSRVAGLFVSGAGGTMDVNAGKDLNLTGAQVVVAAGGQQHQPGDGRSPSAIGQLEQQQLAQGRQPDRSRLNCPRPGRCAPERRAGPSNARGASVTQPARRNHCRRRARRESDGCTKHPVRR